MNTALAYEYFYYFDVILNALFKYIDSGIKLNNNKYNQKLQHIYVMTKWMANNYFLS